MSNLPLDVLGLLAPRGHLRWGWILWVLSFQRALLQPRRQKGPLRFEGSATIKITRVISSAQVKTICRVLFSNVTLQMR